METMVCNFKTCRKMLENEAWITICSHAFCIEHGEQEFRNSLKSIVSCPACNTQLSDKFDVVQADLNPPEIFKSIVLAGLKPDTIMDIAMRAISFWNYQMREETRYHENVSRYMREKIKTLEDTYSTQVQKLKKELVVNKNNVELMQVQLEKQKRQNEQHSVTLEERNRKIQKLKHQLDNLKRDSCHINEMDDIESQRKQSLTNIVMNRYCRSSNFNFEPNSVKNTVPLKLLDNNTLDSQDSFSFNPVIKLNK